MDIRSFLGAFQNGFQPSNQFVLQVMFSPELAHKMIYGLGSSDAPAGMFRSGVSGANIEQAIDWIQRGLLCERTQLPDRAFDQVPMTQYGITENYPYKTDYTALDATFLLPLLNNGQNPVLRLFNAWQNVIQDIAGGMNSSRDLTWPDNYRTEIFITAFDRMGQPSIQYRFEKAYPKSVENIPVTWSDQSEMSRLSVEFTYTCWSLINGASPLPIPFEALGPFGWFGINVPTPIGTVRI